MLQTKTIFITKKYNGIFIVWILAFLLGKEEKLFTAIDISAYACMSNTRTHSKEFKLRSSY